MLCHKIRSERVGVRERKRNVHELLLENVELTATDDKCNIGVLICSNQTEISEVVKKQNETIKSMEEELNRKDEAMNNLQNQLLETERTSSASIMVIANQTAQINKFKKRIHAIQLRSVNRKSKVAKKNKRMLNNEALLQKVFTRPQIQKSAGNSRVNWTKVDIVKALTLRSLSLKAYETALDTWKIPLPAVRTLRTWVKTFNCSPGVNYDVVIVMRGMADSMNLIEKLCVISFDEMSIDSTFVLDPTYDQVLSHSKVQVVLARGICSNWKQPVYFNFDTNMTSLLVSEVVKALEDAGYFVHALVSDLATTNTALWHELGINEYNAKFPNPSCSDRDIHVFADVPHNLKNLRNHLLDDITYFPDGTILLKDTLYDLIASSGTDLKLCPKLNNHLLEVSGSERMRVRFAAQLLSHHTSTLARRKYPGQPTIANFFETVNDGFDVLNSRVPFDNKNQLQSGFRRTNSNQVNALMKLRELICGIRFGSTKKFQNISPCMKPFQKGFLVSIDSLLGLFNDLSRLYGVKYILTSRLNQDALESLFASIRSYGGSNDNPSPSEFRFRLRLILLGSKLRAPGHTNCEWTEDNISFMSANLLNQKILGKKSDNDDNTSIHSTALSVDCPRQEFDPTTYDSLRYLAGYIAWKLKKHNKGIFGTPSDLAPLSALSRNGWIEQLSRGGLLIPNQSILETVQICENEFLGLFEQLKMERSISSKLTSVILAKHPNFNLNIVKEFIHTRIKIKIRNLNDQSKQKSSNEFVLIIS